jgi:hypothetical protein
MRRKELKEKGRARTGMRVRKERGRLVGGRKVG